MQAHPEYTPHPAPRAAPQAAVKRPEAAAAFGLGVLAAATAGWFSLTPRPQAPTAPAPQARVELPAPAAASAPAARSEQPAVLDAPAAAAPVQFADRGPASARDWAAAKALVAWSWPDKMEAFDPIKDKAAPAQGRRIAAWDPSAPEETRVRFDGNAPAAAPAAKPLGNALTKLDEYAGDVGRGVKYFVAAAAPAAIAAAPVAVAPAAKPAEPAPVAAKSAPASRPHVAARSHAAGSIARGGYAAAPQNTTAVSQPAQPAGAAAPIQAAMISMPAAAIPNFAPTALGPNTMKGTVYVDPHGHGGLIVREDGVGQAYTRVDMVLLNHNEYKPFGSRNTWDERFIYGDTVVGEAVYQASPLVFDLAGRGPQTAEKTVLFDIDGSGRKDSLQWINDLAPGTGLLVFDGDRSGTPGENGAELFGDRTKLDGKTFKNGFEALRALVEKAVAEKVLEQSALDSGRLDAAALAALDKAYGLKIKVGGFNKPAISLAAAGVKAIALSLGPISRVRDFDARGNDMMLQDGAVFLRADGSTGAYGDAWLVRKRETMLKETL